MSKHKTQRVKLGVSYSDAWNLDAHLTMVAVNGIDLLIEAGNSYPPNFDGVESWHAKLREIQSGLQAEPDEAYDLVKVGPPREGEFIGKLMGGHYEREPDWEKKYKAALFLQKRARSELVTYWSDLWD